VKSASTLRREREREIRREILLDAAERVFVERGFAGACVEEIARRAGMALGTLYKALPGKEDLFVGVVERRMASFLDFVRERISRTPARLRLQVLVSATFSFFADHGDSFRMYLAATQGFPWHIRAGLGERALVRYQEFVREVERIVASDLPRARRRQVRLAALAVVGALNAVLAEWIDRGSREPAPSVARRLSELLGGLVGALR
jgi:AcrR family transcriptional regulator